MHGVGRALEARVPMYRGNWQTHSRGQHVCLLPRSERRTSEYSAPREMIVDDEASQPQTWMHSENKDE